MHVLRSLAFLTLVLGLFAGCSRSATVQVRGLAPLHVNDANESTPVNLRLYQLKRSDAFTAASVEDLWTKDREVLGEELVGDPVTIAVLPGNDRDLPTPVELGTLAPGVMVIGVLGLFRKAGAEDRRKILLTLDEVDDSVVEAAGYSLRVIAR
ncbi:MAG: type VI secretion system lipoprotein TssJ [Planctomycetota bacterium]|nr:type VI secretion system lipoprotein TssJ [Planctomycetota bacterium]